MKITDWAIIVVIILAPIILIANIRSEQLYEVSRLQLEYTTALRTAVQDGNAALHLNELQRFEAGYGSDKFMRVDRQRGVEAMLDTLALNFGIQDDTIARQAMMMYIPVVLVVDYDGYYLYAMDQFKDELGQPVMEHRWLPRKPFLYTDQIGNSIAFTLDRYVTVIDPATGIEYRGLMEEVSSSVSIPLLQSAETFERTRRETIVHLIQDDLSRLIHKHNQYALDQRFRYVFTLPYLSEEDWNNTVNDVGMLVFLQGIPIGEEHYNSYAFGGGRLAKLDRVVAGIHPESGITYQSNDINEFPFPIQQVFTNKADAAMQGYHEWRGQ